MLGEAAALGAAFCWSFTALYFARAGRLVGAFSVNVIRLSFALPALAIVTLLFLGPDPAQWYRGGRLDYLVLSGVVGLTLGDAALFQALVLLGPRLATLIFATSPIMTALLSIYILDEKLSPMAWSGVLVTVAGVAWVTLERGGGGPQKHRNRPGLGIVLALLGALGQSIGLILSKAGMADAVDPLPATLMRILAAVLSIWLIVFSTGRRGEIIRGWGNRRARAFIAAGAFFGPFAGVYLSIAAIKLTKTGIAATLMATVPILILPVLYFAEGERVSWRAAIGTTIAVMGVALLLMR